MTWGCNSPQSQPEMLPAPLFLCPWIIIGPSPGFVKSRPGQSQHLLAQVGHLAAGAVGLAGVADRPAVHHQTVAEVAALLGGNDLPQGHLHPAGVLDAVHQAHAVDQPDAVGVGDDGRLAEHISHNQVGALAAHSRQRQQGVEIVGHLAVVFIPQNPHTGADVPGLAAAQAAGLDDGLDLFGGGLGQSLHTGIFGKQFLGDHIHPGVGALGRQPHPHQQLPGLFIVQSALRQRIHFFQPLDNGQRPLLLGHILSCLLPCFGYLSLWVFFMIPYINNKKKPFFAKSGPKAGRALRKDRPAVYNKSNLCGPRAAPGRQKAPHKKAA